MKPVGTFKASTTLGDRIQQAIDCRRKYSPPRIPIVLEHAHSTKRPLVQIARSQFLVPPELRVGEFMYKIRKSINMPAAIAVYLMVDDCTTIPSKTLGEYYEEARDPDGWLYLVWAEESTFGHVVAEQGCEVI